MTASAMNRRAFLALVPAAAAGQVLASTPLAKVARSSNHSVLFFSPGPDEWRDCFGAHYQTGIQRLWHLLLARGVPVEINHGRKPKQAGTIFPALRVYADFLPAALAPDFQAWQLARRGRFISFSNIDLWADLGTPEGMAAVCRL